MTAEFEEVVVDADALETENLGKQRTQNLLLRAARRPPNGRRRQIRRRQRLAVELAVGRERQMRQHHKRRRHHVVRQTSPNMRAQRGRIRSLIGRRHHIGHQPLVARLILARNHRALRH